MKKTFITILAFCFTISIFAQEQEQLNPLLQGITAPETSMEELITGTWKVIDTRSNKSGKLTKKEEKTMKTLNKSVFQFTADHQAKVKLFLSKFNVSDGRWHYNAEKRAIIITDKKDPKIHRMRLWFEELENGDMEFYVDETDVVLIVRKQANK